MWSPIEGNKKRPLTESDQGLPKTPDPKALRRLVQNREAARKNRLRKKAYIQQLELSKVKLTQLEQGLQRSNAQGVILGGGGGDVLGADQGVSLGTNNIISDATAFDLGYARWLEDYHRQMSELQAAVQERLPENELRIYVDNCITCIDELMYMKSIVVKSDVLHIINGTWKTPVERFFMWIGGFRPSELIKIFASQIEPSREQYMVICEVQQATHLAEEALSQGFDAQKQSLFSTISFDAPGSPANVNNYMAQMADGMTKLAAFEDFVLQADDLRHQTIHHVLDKLLTTHQAARALIAVAEHFHRVRCLSSLWATRPREN
ncbi:bZIP transcription factor TGA10-like [Bidens hawaiensis]|uniref:bZIP transcription factor TGA10-like n=1 Tax=Bidens hawaiensis TaxID=980011 RepID=UPI004049E5E8